MTDTNKCKKCKGTGEIGGAYAGIKECFHCMGTGEVNWEKYWPPMGTHSTRNTSEEM